MGCKITVESASAHILSINKTDLHEILTDQEIDSLLTCKDWLKFPEDSQIMNQVLIELSETNKKKEIQKYFRNHWKNNRNSSNR